MTMWIGDVRARRRRRTRLGPVRKTTRWVGRDLLHNRHETPRRADRPGVGATGAAPAARATGAGAAECGASAEHRRHPVARANGGAVARPAGAIWAVVDGVQPLLAVARGRDLGSALRGHPTAGGHGRGGGLERPLRGRDGDPRAPARRRCKGGAPETEALGRSQGGFSTKVHLKAEGGGKPLTVLLTPGQQHESTVFEPLLHQGAIHRPGRGRPRVRSRRVSGDKGYTGRSHRAALRRPGIRQTIPKRSTDHRTGPFDRDLYRLRLLVENLI